MATGKTSGAKARMSTAGNMGGATGGGYVVDQKARSNPGGGQGGKSRGAKGRMSVNGCMGGTDHDSTIVDPKVGPGTEIGRTAKQMGPTGTTPKGQYADRMHVAGGFGGAKHNGGIND